jgi:hypothetical protein
MDVLIAYAHYMYVVCTVCTAGMEPPMSWKVLQDARSRQLQLIAQAAAEAAGAGDEGETEGPDDR